MKTKILVIAFATLGLIFTSCSSDDEGSNNCSANYIGELVESEEKLVGAWVLTAVEAEVEIDLTDDDTDNPSKDLFNQFTDCQTDNIYTFNAEREMKFMKGTTATDCPDETTSTHQWKLENNNIYFINDCVEVYIDATFAENNLSFSYETDRPITNVEGEDISTTITHVYSKQVN